MGLLCATDAAPNAATRFLEEPRKIHALKHRNTGGTSASNVPVVVGDVPKFGKKKSTPFGVVSKDCRMYRKLRAYQ
jgi:hypothetical protein